MTYGSTTSPTTRRPSADTALTGVVYALPLATILWAIIALAVLSVVR